MERSALPKLPGDLSWVDMTDRTYATALNAILYTNDNLFICGNAGSGKSLLIKIISRMLKGVAVCSTTGLSALNITQDGIIASTLHSFFKLKPIAVFNKQNFHHNKDMDELLSATRVLVIDECSMMSSHMFDTIIEIMLLYKKAFGNLPRLIMFGDILQLPPVIDTKDTEISKFYKTQYNNKYMFFNGAFYKELGFKVINLTKIYRQKNSDQQALLNRIRDESVTYSDLKQINDLVIPLDEYENSHKNFIHMASTNKAVNEINSRYIQNFKGKPYIYKGVTTGVFEVEKMNLEWEVVLKEGIQIMTLRNQYGHEDSEVKYRNGSVGTVLECNSDHVIALMEDGHETKVIRGDTEQYGYYPENGALQHKVVGTFNNIECKSLRALTIHKSQGKTLEYSYLSLGNWVPQALVYVALSRLTDLKNLGLHRPIIMSDIKANREALDFLQANA